MEEQAPWLRLLDVFLPEALRGGKSRRAKEARLAVALAIFVGAVAFLFALAYPYIAWPVLARTHVAAYSLAGVFLFLPFVLRWTGSQTLVACALAMGTQVVLVFVAWNSHGIRTPGLFFLHVSILIGLALGGRRLGGLAAATALLIVIGFGAIEISGFKQFPPIDADPMLLAVVLGLGLVLVAGVGGFYEAMRINTLRQLREALALAEAANEAKSDFLASMSHELRTPLNSVIGFSRVLSEKEELSSSGADMLSRINTSGVHLLNLVNEILDVSKVESGEVELDLETVDVVELTREVLRELEGRNERSTVELAAEIPRTSIELRSDRQKLRQVMTNLGTNAVKFTRKGMVTLRLNHDNGQAMSLEVIDTGVGIPKQKLREIFEPFTQADTGTSRSFEGSGLGLTISQMLCEALGYELEVESQVGKGSTFRVVF